MGERHVFLLHKVDPVGALRPIGPQKFGGAGAELPAEGPVESRVGVKAEPERRIDPGAALADGVDPVEEPAPESCFH